MLWIPDVLDSRFQSLAGLQIPHVACVQMPPSPHSTRRNFEDTRFYEEKFSKLQNLDYLTWGKTMLKYFGKLCHNFIGI